MKLSKPMHVISVIVGFLGVATLLAVMIDGADNVVFGVSTMHALFCSAILILIAIWVQIGTIHHMMLEKKGEII